MAYTKEQRLVNSVIGSTKQQRQGSNPQGQSFEPKTPIATGMYLPNHSGVSNHPEVKKEIIFGLVPIGAVLPWLKSTDGVPDLSESFLECNGQQVTDVESPLYGEFLPDLNAYGYFGQNRFLRGNTTSGGFGGQDEVTLTISEIPEHSHSTGLKGGAFINNQVSKIMQSGTGQTAYNGTQSSTGTSGGDKSHENKPPYYNVVWIIRIK